MNGATPTRISVLHLEDEPKDSRLVRSTLAADGVDVDLFRVDTEQEFREAIARGGFDLILADHTLPTFDGLSALALAQQLCADVPFICVSGSIGEEPAIEALKSGATDYVLKQRLSRLGPAVRRALQESTERANRKHAEAEVQRLEAQLRHSQKLEAVGQLAGGIAHDFNNLLTVINGYCERLLASAADGSDVRDDLDVIHKAGCRAAALTSQLLAFSRRQVLQPSVVDLNAVVADIERMLGRVIGEHITLVTALDPALGSTMADPGQIEQVIMNLAINARDAMPNGGTLSVETHRVEIKDGDESGFGLRPGGYVMLVVRDTGHGMDEQTVSHIFEPFFTTKEAGKGTGLGLPTVYGIVMQSGGEIAVESAPGQGTTIRVFLPRVDAAVEAAAVQPATSNLAHGQETLLLVEDEELVRCLVREFLESAGYHILEAGSAEEALQVATASTRPINLLITDVVLPGMNGSVLARTLRSMLPRLKTIYVSGYPGDGVFDDGVGPAGAFLAKPFTRHVLTQKVRELLDEQPAAAATVLVLDQDADIQRLLTNILQTAGYAVYTSLDDLPVVGTRRSADVVLVDLASNGSVREAAVDVLRRELPGAQVVLMAGAFGARLLRDADGLGVTATLQKPLNVPRVLETVGRALKGARGSLIGDC